jgi:hypothetical protein
MVMNLRYRGNGLLFLRNVVVYVLLSTSVASVCLMGAAWVRVFASIMTLSLALLPAVAFIVARTDGFSLHDDKQAIIKLSGREISYAVIQRIDMRETSGMVKVIVNQGWFSGITLISALSRKEAPAVVEELKKRLPGVAVSERRHEDWKSLAILLALALSLTASFHGYLYYNHFAVRAAVDQKDWVFSAARNAGKKQAYATGPYSISPPAGFRYLGIEGGMLFFEDGNRTELKVIAPPHDPLRVRYEKILSLTTGLGTQGATLDAAYNSRVGIVPLVLKDLSLSGLEHIRLVSVKGRDFKALISQGSRKGRELATILIYGDSSITELHCFTDGRVRLDDLQLQAILAGIQRRPEH